MSRVHEKLRPEDYDFSENPPEKVFLEKIEAEIEAEEFEKFETITIEEYQNYLYWEVALELINAWSTYNKNKKLYVNATHKETEHRVAHVTSEYYGDNPELIRKSEKKWSKEVDKTLQTFTDICNDHHISTVTRHWLYENIPNGNKAASYRKKIKRRKDKNAPIVPLAKL